MDIHHIGPEHISKNISGVYLQKNIFRKTSPDMDIHHIGLEHISENISGVYLQKNISGHGYTSHLSRTESTVRDGPMDRSGTSQSTRQNIGIPPFKPKSRMVWDGPWEFRVNKAWEQSRVPKHRFRKEPVIRNIK